MLARRKGGGLGGGVPSTTHLSKALNAAWTTMCWGPVLMGLLQPMMLAGTSPKMDASACEVPAISQVRIRSVLGCCAPEYPNWITSVWVSAMKTGTFRSVRMRSVSDPAPETRFDPREAPNPKRLWRKMPSKVSVRGCTASANVVR